MYELKIEGSGKVKYNGIAFVRQKGEINFAISENKLKEIVKLFYSKNFFELNHIYDNRTVPLIHPNGQIELLTEITEITSTLTFFVGELPTTAQLSYFAPQSLKELVQDIEMILDIEKYIACFGENNERVACRL